MAADAEPGAVPSIPVPEVRDYQRINAELHRLLDLGASRVRLTGVEGQRLLLSGLTGRWNAVVDVEGRCGPELAGDLDAPGLVVVAHGPVGDGAGRGLRDGFLIVRGDAGPAAGYAQRAGTIVVAGSAGPRAGSNQSGGVLVVLGKAGALAGERQSGGRLYLVGHEPGPHAGWARRGGGLFWVDTVNGIVLSADPADTAILRDAIDRASPWVGPGPV